MLKTSKLLILHTAHTAWNGHTGRGLCTGLCTAPDRFQRLTEGQEPQLEQPQAPFYCLGIDPDAIALSSAPVARTGRPQRPFAVPGRPTASLPPPPTPPSPFADFLRSTSIKFRSFVMNGDRIAAAQPSCSSRQNRHLGHRATCFSTRSISASESSFKIGRAHV